MAAVMSAAVAIANATFWSDLASAVVFGFLTVVWIWVLATMFRRNAVQSGPTTPAGSYTKPLLLVVTAAWVIAALIWVAVAITS